MSDKMTYGDVMAETERTAPAGSPHKDWLFRPFLVETPAGWMEAAEIPGLVDPHQIEYHLHALKNGLAVPALMPPLCRCTEHGTFMYNTDPNGKPERVTKYDADHKAWWAACRQAQIRALMMGWPTIDYPVLAVSGERRMMLRQPDLGLERVYPFLVVNRKTGQIKA